MATTGIDAVAMLAQLLGGTKATQTTTSDTSQLQALLSQLQGADYQQLLTSIFQQAGAQIPGLSAARSNATGARSTGNSVLGADLDKLLQSTVLKAQQQLVQQQQNNQQLQANVAGAISNGSRSSTTSQGTNLGGAAQKLALLTLASKAAGSDSAKKLKKAFGFGEDVEAPEGTGGLMDGISFSGSNGVSELGAGGSSGFSFGEIPSMATPDISSIFSPDFSIGDIFGSGGADFSLDSGLGLDFELPSLPSTDWDLGSVSLGDFF